MRGARGRLPRRELRSLPPTGLATPVLRVCVVCVRVCMDCERTVVVFDGDACVGGAGDAVVAHLLARVTP